MLGHSMNNAKWVRLFTHLAGLMDTSIVLLTKLVWDDQPRSMWIRDKYQDAQFESDFYCTSAEAMIGGYPRGWYSYKEIEWIDFAGSSEKIMVLKGQIESIGRFDLEITGAALRLFAYRRISRSQQ